MKNVIKAFAGALFAVVMIVGAPQIAAAQVSAAVEVDSSNVAQLVAPSASPATHVLVASCDSTQPDCQEYKQRFQLMAALSKGGWLTGVAGMHTAEFYTIDTSTNAVGLLSNQCATAGAPANGADICSYLSTIKTSTVPELVMLNIKTGAHENASGYLDDQGFRFLIVPFLKK